MGTRAHLLGKGCKVAQLPVRDVSGDPQPNKQGHDVGDHHQQHCPKQGLWKCLGWIGNLSSQCADRIPVV